MRPLNRVTISFSYGPRRLCPVLLLIAFTIAGSAQDQQIPYWSTIVERSQLKDIVAAFAPSSRPRWPHIGFVGPAQDGRRIPQRSELLSLAEALRKKIATQSTLDEDTSTALENARVEGILSYEIRRYGGYSNLVLADSLYRLSLSRLCRQLVLHPGEYSQVEGVLRRVGHESLAAADVGSMIDEQTGAHNATDLLREARREDLLRLSFQLANTTSLEAAFQVATDGNASHLLQKQALGLLIFRLSESGLVAEYILPGLIEYLRRGGDLNGISLGDLRPFASVIGSSETEFRYEPMGLPVLLPGYLYHVVTAFTEPVANQPFVRLALE